MTPLYRTVYVHCFTIAIVFFISSNVHAINYVDYSKIIARAETDVVNGAYKDALKRYDSAFATYPYNNPIDVYVAAQLAAYGGDHTRSISYISKGISFGLPLQTINANPHLDPLIKTISTTSIDSYWNIYKQRINPDARAATIKLIQRDQAVVRSKGSIYERDQRTLKAEWIPLWDSLMNDIMMLTKTFGFPAQKVVGTLNGDDSLFSPSPHSIFVYYILIHHGRSWPIIGELLREEMQKGNITPQMYACIYDGRNDTEEMRYFSFRTCSTRECEKAVKSRRKEIDAARQEIGLCTYEVMEQKFASTLAYAKWRKSADHAPQPVFDFQPDLHFREH